MPGTYLLSFDFMKRTSKFKDLLNIYFSVISNMVSSSHSSTGGVDFIGFIFRQTRAVQAATIMNMLVQVPLLLNPSIKVVDKESKLWDDSEIH
jgi:hypothetical protein